MVEARASGRRFWAYLYVQEPYKFHGTLTSCLADIEIWLWDRQGSPIWFPQTRWWEPDPLSISLTSILPWWGIFFFYLDNHFLNHCYRSCNSSTSVSRNTIHNLDLHWPGRHVTMYHMIWFKEHIQCAIWCGFAGSFEPMNNIGYTTRGLQCTIWYGSMNDLGTLIWPDY